MWRVILGFLALSAAALGQQTFEVASVKPSAPAVNLKLGEMLSRTYDSQPRGWLPVQKGRLSLKNRPLAGLIANAYRVRQREVSGPSWMADTRFDVEATFPAGTPSEQVSEMLRALLEDRFGLVVHREEKEAFGYALVQAKGGAKLMPATPEQPAETQPTDEEARREQQRKMQEQMQKRMAEMRKEQGSSGSMSRNTWRAPNATMSEVADWLAPLVEKPVVDATGLEGKYKMEVAVERSADDTQEYAVQQALAKLGLKLEARKMTVSTVMVDKVERTPKEN